MPKKKSGQRAAVELSKRRRAGEEIPPPPKGRYSEATRQRALHDLAVGRQRKKRAGARAARGRAPSRRAHGAR